MCVIYITTSNYAAIEISLDYIKTISIMVADEDVDAEEDVIEDRVFNAMDLVIKRK